MNDELKNTVAEHLAYLLEQADLLKSAAGSIRDTDFETVTPDIWSAVQTLMSSVSTQSDYVRQSVTCGSQVLDNDALLAHATASLTL